NFPRISTEQVGQLTAGMFHNLFRLPAKAMGTGSRVTKGAVEGQTTSHHSGDRRVGRRGGGVIKIQGSHASTVKKTERALSPLCRMGQGAAAGSGDFVVAFQRRDTIVAQLILTLGRGPHFFAFNQGSQGNAGQKAMNLFT